MDKIVAAAGSSAFNRGTKMAENIKNFHTTFKTGEYITFYFCCVSSLGNVD